MRLRPLGNSGLIVSEICLGGMTFGGQTPAWDARQMMEQYTKQGGNFIDTANSYNAGSSEEVIGQWLADSGNRQHVILGTKTFMPEDNTPNHRRLSRQAILYSVEQSLRRLQTDYIDVYYTHYWDAQTPLEETLAALQQLIQQGKVRYIACSNYFGWQIMQARETQRRGGWSPFVALQAHYSLIERGIEREILSLLQEEKLGLVTWSPLAGGFLSGKFLPGTPLDEKTRLGQEEGVMPRFYRELALNERGWLILETVQGLARHYKALPEQIAIAWLLSKPWVSAVIVGASQINHIDSNLQAVDLLISEDDLRRLDDVSAIDMGYPGYMPYLLDELL